MATLLTATAVVAFGSIRYSLSPLAFVEHAIRVAAAPLFAVVYRDDLAYVEETIKGYTSRGSLVYKDSAEESWHRIASAVPGVKIVAGHGLDRRIQLVPFIYERQDAENLRKFRATHKLDRLVEGASGEYEAMLRLAGWVGTRWDHGTDEVPGGTRVCDPSAVVRAGEKGAKFWCEIAARTMVHAATSLGWPARLVTASRDGYTWEHAVAELWSNQFEKWFVIDPDFNVVFEREGIPLSAFELVHRGEQLQAAGLLKTVPFSPAKESLPIQDLIPYFAYAHLDMRNDWCSRPLRRGSPAGGDVATWWTSRKSLGPILTAAKQIEDAQRFDWTVNRIDLHAIRMQRIGVETLAIQVQVTGYGPNVQSPQIRVDDGPWESVSESVIELSFSPGRHKISSRFLLGPAIAGPETSVVLDFLP